MPSAAQGGPPCATPPAKLTRLPPPRRPTRQTLSGSGTGKIKLKPILMQKGETRIALYGGARAGAAHCTPLPVAALCVT